MHLEIEAKFHLADPPALRRRLEDAGARRLHAVRETNTFFDFPDGRLRSADSGLRLRVETGGRERVVVTHKGPKVPGRFKTRPEHEFAADDAAAVRHTFAALGLTPVLTFEKDRETWRLGDCEVVLDRVATLGDFVEVEGPSEDAVTEVCKRLGLTDPPLQRGYAAMLGAGTFTF